ncbi:MAG: UvrB/UvrC motif-containing protein [Planctomycetes bacterium]|nr:UvrB/UvrC motif-containing protein [Planctomycetota bacterium]
MLCQSCQKHQASVHQFDLQYDEQGASEFKVLNLCAPCAKQRGLPLPGKVPTYSNVVSMLSKAFLGIQGAKQQAAPDEVERSCPDCGWTLRDFRQTSRFGCAKDYDVFSDFVDEVLERIHGTSEHPVNADEAELARLRTEMEEAVGCEDYEAAAELRDRIRGLEERMEDAEKLEF